MTDLPAPLTPPDCDLRGLEWMPLYGDRLFGSDTWLMAGPDARCAAMMLWWAAWKQCPAGSLADQDRALAQLAGYGIATKAWLGVKAEALRGWIKCSDGRLYHPVVCEFAREAWDRRVKERDRKAAYRAARTGTIAGQDKPETGTQVVVPWDRTGTDGGQIPGQDADEYGDGHVEKTVQDRTGQEKERKKDSPSTPPKPPRAKARTAITPDWTPNPTGRIYAESRGLTPAEIAKFINHHQGKGSLMANWDAAWRTWCDKAVEFGRAPGLLLESGGLATAPMSGQL